MTSVGAPRTDLADFLSDLLDFVEEKIKEALSDPGCQLAAITEAAGAMPIMRHRLREDQFRWTQFVLVLGSRIEAGYWQEWWDSFGRMDREEFSSEADALIGPGGPIAALRGVLAV